MTQSSKAFIYVAMITLMPITFEGKQLMIKISALVFGRERVVINILSIVHRSSIK